MLMVRDGNSIINRFYSNSLKPAEAGFVIVAMPLSHQKIEMLPNILMVRDGNSIINRFYSNSLKPAEAGFVIVAMPL